uniref:Uncharacterized protein n=1 Tax=Ascaris lumbricoides TaxID=6252 RepID=A0A0M3ISM6_ASCLU
MGCNNVNWMWHKELHIVRMEQYHCRLSLSCPRIITD